VTTVDETVEALAAQHAELESLLAGLPAGQWHAATPCEGWDVADVVLHLTQSDELAIASATGRFDELASQQSGAPLGGLSVDESAALMVERERALPVADLLGRWTSTTAHLVELLDGMDLSTRVSWVAGTLSARTLATTRLAETWIHGGDIADALGRELAATDRLRLIARLAWRTLPYAFGSAGLTLRGPVALRLTSPSGNAWDFLPDQPAVTTITGPAADLCEVAARRRDPAGTSLTGDGPDAADVLALVRTYA
jgi:uncharacterized protein (TIGR03084 family)